MSCRYDSIVKALNTSNETVLALGANFSLSADSHLVAMQVGKAYQRSEVKTEIFSEIYTASVCLSCFHLKKHSTLHVAPLGLRPCK